MKTLHLEKTGSDYVFWFNGFEKSTHKKLEIQITTFKAWRYDQKKKKCVYSEKDNEAINFQLYIHEPADGNDHFLDIGIFNPLDTIQDIYYFASLDIRDFQKIKDLKIAIKATIKLFHKGELKEIWQTLN